MSSMLKWVRKAWNRSLDPECDEITDFPAKPLTRSDMIALSCQCHPDLEPDQPHVLCDKCKSFVTNCRWIQIHKLSAAQRSKLSRRQWRRGAQIMDGDASESLNWIYEHTIQSNECHLCQLLWSTLYPEQPPLDLIRPQSVQLTVRYDPSQRDKARLQVNVSGYGGSYNDLSLRLYYNAAPLNNDVAASLAAGNGGTGPGRDQLNTTAFDDLPVIDDKMLAAVGKCTGSSVNHDLAKIWIEQCRQNHIACNMRRSDTFPARLVHVGTELKGPYLYEVSLSEPAPEYFTLSHCWGGESPIVLRLAHVEEFKNSIPFHSLSRTFQEAIRIVRNLRYDYIWIDSLCIMQDSTEDWKRESEIMGNIYRNAICTIAATDSVNGDQGCFRQRYTLRNRACQLWRNEDQGLFVDIQDTTAVERYRREVNSGPLNIRAWVLQERVLSARVLHYAATSVYWDCEAAHLSDSGHHIDDEQNQLSWGFNDGDLRLFKKLDFADAENFANRWQSSVEKYSDMRLTVPTDRFIAFKGIIKYAEEMTKLKCIYGLWREHLMAHMLWRVGDAVATTSKRLGKTNPSWSWTSVTGPIRYFPAAHDDIASMFWYPDNEEGWPTKTGDINDPNLVEDVLAEMSLHMKLGVDPVNGYSSKKVFCARYLPDLGSDAVIYIEAKMNKPSGRVMVVCDDLGKIADEEIKESVCLQGTSHRYGIFIGAWPDVAREAKTISEETLCVRICVEGAKSPKIKIDGITSSDDEQTTDSNLLAPYAVHTSGLMLEPTGGPNEYRRVGFFRAMETFSGTPPPHPQGLDPESPFYQDGWFGKACQSRVVSIV